MTVRYDVAVVGGGSAGVAAALAAAACGARTLLVEASDRLGGNVSLALVNTICGLYLPAQGDTPRLAHSGLPARLEERLRRAGAAGPPERAGRVFYLPIDPTGYARVLSEEVEAAPGLQVQTGTPMTGVDETADGFRLHFQGGNAELSLLVDATGDAAVAAKLGAECSEDPGDALQSPSYIIELGGVEARGLEDHARMQLSAALAGAVRHGELPAGCESVALRPGFAPDRAYLTLGVPKLPGRTYAPLDPGYMRALEKQARDSAETVLEVLCRTRRPFAKARVSAWPERIGLRETLRLRTRIELDRDDVLQAHRREDEVALSSWPIELWRDHRRARFQYPTGPCGVPLLSMVSRSHPRLGCAGRCVGGSREALGALRVIGTSLATGEAIGTAAALAADSGGTLLQVAPAAVRGRTFASEGRPA
ncbi:MAG: FAD-dependent oxidoreductase [bacterium]|nr:FAD-dependent oxidoreductase [bacterium]MCP5070144.1 FAD-dependent oxidoreductase [bacterium]